MPRRAIWTAQGHVTRGCAMTPPGSPCEEQASRDVEPAPLLRSASTPRTADFGLVVGVDNYPHYLSLRGAVRDAERFHRWLLDANGGAIPEERARLVISSLQPLSPLKDQIDRELDQIVREANALGGGRRLYFHFSGHGIGIQPDDVALLLAMWSLDRLAVHGFALSTHAYRGNLVKMGLFDEIVILLDCCRTTVTGAVGSPPELTLTPDRHCDTEYFVAYATPLGQSALERPTATGSSWEGVFTRRVLRILRGRSGLNAIELQRALKGESHSESQRAQVVNSICSDSSRFGRPGLKHRFEIRFSEEKVGKRVTIGRDPDGPEQQCTVDATRSWNLALEGGLYMIADGDTEKVIYHPDQLLDDDEVMTLVEF